MSRWIQNKNGILIPNREAGFIQPGIGLMSKKQGGGGGDPYWSNVVSLLHFDGTDGSTVITDQISANTWTCNGSVALGTGQAKFGSAALNFPSNSSSNNLKGPSTLSPFAGDFTVEFFAYPIANSTLYAACFFGVDSTSGVRGVQIYWQTTNQISVDVTGVVSTITSVGTLTLNTWNYIAVSVIGTTAYLILNGTATSGAWVVGAGNPAYKLTFGQHVDGITNYKGYIDEFRLTKGLGRYSGNIGVPTAPFPNHA